MYSDKMKIKKVHGVSPFLWSIESRDNLTEHERPSGEHEGNFLYVEVSPVFLFFFVFEDKEGNFLDVEVSLFFSLSVVLSFFLYLSWKIMRATCSMSRLALSRP